MGAPERATRDRGLSDPSIVRVRAVIEAGLAALERHREDVNRLNVADVADVADGDTGDNMASTLRAVVAELDRLSGASEGRTIDEIGRTEIVASVARAALLGARGSSGVILSQLIRGAAEELASRPGELVDPVLIGAALARAADQAYGSVRDPAEGTMLSVVRAMAHRVASELAHLPEPRLAPDATALQQDLVIAEVIECAVTAGESAAQSVTLGGPGVLDAGSYGLVVLMGGMLAVLRGAQDGGADEPIGGMEVSEPRPVAPAHTSITYRYCTNFVVLGAGVSPRAMRAALEAIGDAVLVVGDTSTVKVHVHTDDPDAATAAVRGTGTISRVEVRDMRDAAPTDSSVPAVPASASDLSAPSAPAAPSAASPAGGEAVPATGLVALADGAGLRELLVGFGAQIAPGGADASATAILAAIAATGAAAVVVAPDSPAGAAAAALAAERAPRPVTVLATASPQAVLAAAAAYLPGHSPADDAATMTAAAARLRTGSVAAARADDPAGRFRAGEALGELDGEPVAWGDPATTLAAVAARLSEGAELVSCLGGVAPPLDEAAAARVVAEAAGSVGVTWSTGGQRASWWLLSAQ